MRYWDSSVVEHCGIEDTSVVEHCGIEDTSVVEHCGIEDSSVVEHWDCNHENRLGLNSRDGGLLCAKTLLIFILPT